MKKIILFVIYLLCIPLLLGLITLAIGGIVATALHLWATDGEQPFVSFVVALLGELAWLLFISRILG